MPVAPPSCGRSATRPSRLSSSSAPASLPLHLSQIRRRRLSSAGRRAGRGLRSPSASAGRRAVRKRTEDLAVYEQFEQQARQTETRAAAIRDWNADVMMEFQCEEGENIPSNGRACTEDDIFRGRVTDKWRRFMNGQIQRARLFLDSASR